MNYEANNPNFLARKPFIAAALLAGSVLMTACGASRESAAQEGPVVAAAEPNVDTTDAPVTTMDRVTTTTEEPTPTTEHSTTTDIVTTTTEAPEDNESTTTVADDDVEDEVGTETINSEFYGNLVLDNLPLGTDYITAEMRDGELIKVPRLNLETAQTASETSLALIACYFTTGSEACLKELAQDPGVHAVLDEYRIAVNNAPSYTEHPSTQFVIKDDPRAPAEFSLTDNGDGSVTLRLDEGFLVMGNLFFDSPEPWQGPNTRAYEGGTYETDPSDPAGPALEFIFWPQ